MCRGAGALGGVVGVEGANTGDGKTGRGEAGAGERGQKSDRAVSQLYGSLESIQSCF